ncbi:MAG TPA: peptidoglycan DD-metalloendopeptidase family protein [Terriglobia bacterium]|nr:peptidoglycan DD-metalloendopeptidase family protein [Terriglobia bacterium]
MIPDVNLSGLTTGGKLEPKDVATKVQAMFLEVMMKAMEDNVDAEDGLFGGSSSSEIYRGMLREQLAAAVSAQMKSPLAAELDKALSKQPASPDKSENSENPANPENPALPVSGVITSPKGWRHDPINGQMRYHAGTDIAAPEGTPIKAVADGRVIESGSKHGYGNTVVVQTEDGRKMLYAHNNQNFVQVGDWVSRGDAIAEVGATGRATGPHVHFEVKF